MVMKNKGDAPAAPLRKELPLRYDNEKLFGREAIPQSDTVHAISFADPKTCVQY